MDVNPWNKPLHVSLFVYTSFWFRIIILTVKKFWNLGTFHWLLTFDRLHSTQICPGSKFWWWGSRIKSNIYLIEGLSDIYKNPLYKIFNCQLIQEKNTEISEKKLISTRISMFSSFTYEARWGQVLWGCRQVNSGCLRAQSTCRSLNCLAPSSEKWL